MYNMFLTIIMTCTNGALRKEYIIHTINYMITKEFLRDKNGGGARLSLILILLLILILIACKNINNWGVR